KGIVNFNDNLGMFSFIARQDLSERDQKAAKESFEAFKELVNRFPESKYTPDARARMTYIVNSLAKYEVHVARYYYSRGAYVAAIGLAADQAAGALLQRHRGLGHEVVVERAAALGLQALAARLHQRVARRRERQLVDDHELQCLARHVHAFPEGSGRHQDAAGA